MINYSVIFIALLIIELAYFEIAKITNIIDKPNERSLHKQNTIRGGGIIFGIAFILYYYYSSESYIFFCLGLLIIFIISFWDDILNLSSIIRVICHLVSIILLLCQLNFLGFTSLFISIALVIVYIAIVNAYNFMDGVNGITGIFSLVVLLSLAYLNNYVKQFVTPDFINILTLSVVVFLFFNFRKRAICFSGDVGSVTIAYIILFLISKLMMSYNDYKYIFFLSLYGIDTFYTIIYRLQQKENIFKAHKVHFFQILVEDYHLSHLQVALLYGVLQLLLNIWIFNFSISNIIFYTPFVLILITLHVFRKNVNKALTIK